MPACYMGATVRDFGGRTVYVLQVRLSTFGTFVKSDVGWMRVLLEVPAKGSDWPPSEEDLLGIGVDCLVTECRVASSNNARRGNLARCDLDLLRACRSRPIEECAR